MQGEAGGWGPQFQIGCLGDPAENLVSCDLEVDEGVGCVGI